ncbi:MAG: leucine-rich repeat protein [Eubacteriales bacterium]
MKIRNIFAVFAALSLLLFALASCSDDEKGQDTDAVYFTVSFNTAGAGEIEPRTVRSGQKIAEPVAPEKDNYIFNGWLNGTVMWDFGTDTVSSDMTLTAQWIDARTVFTYTQEGGKATITGYNGKLSSISIPKSIAGYEVTAIGEGAFRSLSSESVKKIVVPESVSAIGASAFEGCSDIEIEVKGRITSLGEKAFANCNALSAISFGESLEKIPFAAFSGCSSLTDVRLPDSVNTVCENAFEMCTLLKTLMCHASELAFEDSAFFSCDSFVSVFVYGTPEEWDSVDIATGGEGNDALIDADVYFYSETPADGIDTWYMDPDGNPRCR